MTKKERQQLAGMRIKLARVAAGLSQEELAARLGVSHATVSRIEKGTKEPSTSQSRELSGILRQARDYLEGYDGDLVDAEGNRVNPRYVKSVVGLMTYPPLLAAA